MKNILIATDTEEQLQGIIRCIEALDEKHEVGILHGVHSVTEIDEPCQLIAELANATLVLSPNITLQDIKRSGTLRTIYVDVPKDKSREEILLYMKDYYSDIVSLILNE